MPAGRSAGPPRRAERKHTSATEIEVSCFGVQGLGGGGWGVEFGVWGLWCWGWGWGVGVGVWGLRSRFGVGGVWFGGWDLGSGCGVWDLGVGAWDLGLGGWALIWGFGYGVWCFGCGVHWVCAHSYEDVRAPAVLDLLVVDHVLRGLWSMKKKDLNLLLHHNVQGLKAIDRKKNLLTWRGSRVWCVGGGNRQVF